MASINGISVRKLTHFLGHEGEDLYQGTLYLGSKKLGFWSQDSWGGPDRVNLDDKYSARLLNAAITALNPDKAIHGSAHGKGYTVPYDLELLLNDYLALTQDEKAFQQALRTGYTGVMIASDGYHQAIWSLPESYTKLSDAELHRKLDAQIEKARSSFLKETPYNKHTIKVYRTPADFSLGEAISVENILSRKPLKTIISDAEHSTQAKPESQVPAKDSPTLDPEL